MANYFGNRSPNAFQEFIQGTQAAALEDRERTKNALLQQQMQNQAQSMELNKFKIELARDAAKRESLKQDMTIGMQSLGTNPTPEAYKTFYETLTTKHGLPPTLLAPPEKMQTSEQIMNYVYGPQIMAQKIKRLGEKPTISGGYMLQPGSNTPVALPPTQQQMMQNQFKAKELDLKSQQVGQGKTTIREMANPEDPTKPPGLYLINSKTGDILKQVGLSKEAGQTEFTDEGLDFIARNFILTGQIPGLGLGRNATQARIKIINRVPKLLTEENLTPADMQTNKIVYGALKSELSRTQSQRGPMLAFAKTADKNLEIALNLAEKVNNSGVPVLNRWINAGRRSLAGDPDVAAFDAATRVAVNEFAKVTSSATGGGVTSDQARKEIESMLNTAQAPAQFRAVAKTLKMDMDNRIVGYEDSINRVKTSLKSLGERAGGGRLPGSSGRQTPKATPQQVSAYKTKLGQVNALPDGPQKQNLLKQMQDFAAKWGIQ